MTKPGGIWLAWSSRRMLPAKYARLLEAQAGGLRVPETLWLAGDACDARDARDADGLALAAFAARLPQHRFIVRSAQAAEDAAGHSLAGHFWSSPAVAADQLSATVRQAALENRRILAQLGRDGATGLMVQAYIEHSLGGVLFLPWSFFSAYACLEYSPQGVQQVVAGRSETAVFGIGAGEGQIDPLPVAGEMEALLPELRQLCRQLQAVFPFPLDCEWAYDRREQALVVLQVRPQTHAVGALLPLPEAGRPVLPPGAWGFGALSESLGKLSPLSFGLLRQLYADAAPALRELGCKALSADFLLRLPDGTVLVDAARERAFYAPTRLGGFWRGFRAPAAKARGQTLLQGYDPLAPFSYRHLSEVFNAWLLENWLEGGQGRSAPVPAHAYELSFPSPGSLPTAPPTRPVTLRAAFFAEFAKLRQALAGQGHLVFCTWDEYQRADFGQAWPRQHSQAGLALYDHAACGLPEGGGSGVVQSLGGQTVAVGRVLRIDHPASHVGGLPEGCILVAPYVDNRWAGMLGRLRGIVVMQGGRLSHAAIVAREYGVPYLQVSPAVFAGLQAGVEVELDSVRLRVRVL